MQASFHQEDPHSSQEANLPIKKEAEQKQGDASKIQSIRRRIESNRKPLPPIPVKGHVSSFPPKDQRDEESLPSRILSSNYEGIREKVQHKFTELQKLIKGNVHPIKDEHGVKLYKFITEEGEKEIRIFGKNYSNVPDSGDFVEYLVALQVGARSLLEPEEKFSAQISQLNQKTETAKDQIKAIRFNHHEEAGFEEAKKILNRITLDFLGFVQQANPKLTLQDLEKARNEANAQKGMPEIMNCFQINGHEYQSLQIPAGEQSKKFTPSSIRTEERLPNFLITAFSPQREDSYAPDFLGLRHASFPPIGIKDKFERRAKSIKTVKESAYYQAKLALDAGRQEDPLVISISSMMLFSPVPEKLESPVRKLLSLFTSMKSAPGESEYLQLYESLLAMRQLAATGFIMDYNGKTVNVQLDINVMNIGVNQIAIHPGIPTSSLQRQLNAQGYEKFDNKIFEFLNSLPNAHPLREKYVNFFKNIPNIEKEETLLAKFATHPTRTECYKKLEEAHEAYLQAEEDPSERKKIGKSIQALYSQIDLIESQISSQAEKIEKMKVNFYKKNQNKLGQIEREYLKYLNDSLKNNPNNILLIKERDVVQLHSEGRKIYYLKLFKKVDYLFDFPIRFVLAVNSTEEIPEYGCKSGEDRTGFLNTLIEAYVVFYNQNGHYPRLNNMEDQVRMKQRVPDVYKQSTSLVNTGLNARGARGFQVPEKTGSVLGEHRKRFESQAKIAKGNFAEAKKLAKQKRSKNSEHLSR